MSEGNTAIPWPLHAHVSDEHRRVMALGADLLSDRGENPEYDRAIVELVSEVIGLSPAEWRDSVLADLRDLKAGS